MPSKDQLDSLSGGSSEDAGGSNIYVPSFSPVLGGTYGNGTLNHESTYGFWWGNTAYNGTGRYSLYYGDSSLYTGGGRRNAGHYVRCIQAS